MNITNKIPAAAQIPSFKFGRSRPTLASSACTRRNLISIQEYVPFVPLQLLAMVEMSSWALRTITQCLRLYFSPEWEVKNVGKISRNRAVVSAGHADVSHSDISPLKEHSFRAFMSNLEFSAWVTSTSAATFLLALAKKIKVTILDWGGNHNWLLTTLR